MVKSIVEFISGFIHMSGMVFKWAVDVWDVGLIFRHLLWHHLVWRVINDDIVVLVVLQIALTLLAKCVCVLNYLALCHLVSTVASIELNLRTHTNSTKDWSVGVWSDNAFGWTLNWIYCFLIFAANLEIINIKLLWITINLFSKFN